MNREEARKKYRANAFKINNGKVLATVNLLREKYCKLTIVEAGLKNEGITREDFTDCINYLQEEGYIRLRDIETHEEKELADSDVTELEGKVTGKGIKLLSGTLSDDTVYLG